jgi:hypothetical protein
MDFQNAAHSCPFGKRAGFLMLEDQIKNLDMSRWPHRERVVRQWVPAPNRRHEVPGFCP